MSYAKPLLYVLLTGCLIVGGCHRPQPAERWVRQCKANDGDACLRLGEYFSALNKETKAANFYFSACANNKAEGCTAAGLNALLDLNNTPKAVELFNRSCVLSPDKGGCFWLGEMDKEGLLKPEGQGEKFWQQGCAAGDYRSCTALADSVRLKENTLQSINEAKNYYRLACRGGDKKACLSLKALDENVRKEQGEALLEEAVRYEARYDMDRALRLLYSACNEGSANACVKAGMNYELSLGSSKAVEKAYSLYVQGCELNNAEGCVRAADLVLQEGIPNAKNRTLAVSLLTKACIRGRENACIRRDQLVQEVNKEKRTNAIEEAKAEDSFQHEKIKPTPSSNSSDHKLEDLLF